MDQKVEEMDSSIFDLRIPAYSIPTNSLLGISMQPKTLTVPKTV
jgi:hypothetical protein